MNWQKIYKIPVRHNIKLSAYTSFKIGGPARFFLQPKDICQLKAAVKALKNENISFKILGAGSNLLIKDGGFDGAVIRLRAPYFSRIKFSGKHAQAGAGLLISQFIVKAKARGLGGAEFLSGIPGTLGGALVMNAGAWHEDISKIVEKITVMDYNGKVKIIATGSAGFKYRSSGLNKYIVLSVSLHMEKKALSEINSEVSYYLKKRQEMQDLKYPSAGCVFRNPKNDFAGRLIDACGLKGKQFGRAMISNRHANFIVNKGGAQAEDVLGLIEFVRKTVKDKYEISLEPEIKIW